MAPRHTKLFTITLRAKASTWIAKYVVISRDPIVNALALPFLQPKQAGGILAQPGKFRPVVAAWKLQKELSFWHFGMAFATSSMQLAHLLWTSFR